MKRKTIQALLGLSMTSLILAAMAGGLALAESDAAYASPGTYTATETGRNGDITLTVTFSETAIEDIQIEDSETPTIGEAAMEEMRTQVLDSQTLTPDTISGATVSCEAFLTALSDAASQAGAAATGTGTPEAAPAAKADYSVTEADLIIVGAGGAGMTAAHTAMENGASVILIEKSGVVGGNSLCSAMGINASGSQVQEELGMEYATDELLKELQMRYGGRENLVDAYVEASGETVDWLHTDLGIDFSGETSEDIDSSDPLANVQDEHPSGSGLFMVTADAEGTTADTLVSALKDALEEDGAVVYVNTTATALVADESGAICGVKASGADGEEIVFSGKAVILATGGFGQNHEMVESLRPDLANSVTDEIAPTTGDGIIMAQAVGAKTVDLDQMQTFPHVVVGDTWLPPMSMPGGFMTSAIFINQDAQRYTTEGFDPTTEDTLAQEMVFTVFNEDDLNDDLKQLEARGLVKSGDTAEELALELGLDAGALQATIDQWNADCEAGSDSQFDNQTLKPLTGKLYGYRFGVGAHYMMGGVLINENTEVLDENEEPIPGLYAAGEVTGGFHGTIRVDGSGTGDAFVFGHLAGLKAATAVTEN